MLSTLPVIALSFGLLASAAPLRTKRAVAPAGWATEYLEDYTVYHTRYLALDCADKHDTTFFNDCCHPLLSSETLAANRLPYCNPAYYTNGSASASASWASASASASAAASSSVAEWCEPETTSATTTSTTPAWTPTTTSTSTTPAYVAPTTTSTTPAYTPPTTTHTTTTQAAYVAPTTTTTKAAATTQAASSGSYSGHATYFWQGGVAGACGTVHSDSDYIAAIPSGWYGNSGSTSQYCGKYINIVRTSDGATVTVMVADECPSCTTGNSLDLSHGAFDAIATDSEGEVDITWSWA